MPDDVLQAASAALLASNALADDVSGWNGPHRRSALSSGADCPRASSPVTRLDAGRWLFVYLFQGL